MWQWFPRLFYIVLLHQPYVMNITRILTSTVNAQTFFDRSQVATKSTFISWIIRLWDFSKFLFR
ncbi:hypothetical protein HanIR_Chr02g0098431 [Helianthus annuus]|nr:hypothetical protein HanIR_Chr02g0098431 [Helianthus annuus]